MKTLRAWGLSDDVSEIRLSPQPDADLPGYDVSQTLPRFDAGGRWLSGQSGPEPADLVLLYGKIVTVDDDRPEAQALAAKDGVILAVGSDAEIEPYIGDDTRVLDIEGMNRNFDQNTVRVGARLRARE